MLFRTNLATVDDANDRGFTVGHEFLQRNYECLFSLFNSGSLEQVFGDKTGFRSGKRAASPKPQLLYLRCTERGAVRHSQRQPDLTAGQRTVLESQQTAGDVLLVEENVVPGACSYCKYCSFMHIIYTTFCFLKGCLGLGFCRIKIGQCMYG